MDHLSLDTQTNFDLGFVLQPPRLTNSISLTVIKPFVSYRAERLLGRLKLNSLLVVNIGK
jgi:hypothetical protein